MTIEEDIDKLVELRRRRGNIICPYCDYEQDTETKNQFITYWGDEPSKVIECEHCNKAFFVKEKVEREFVCTKEDEI